MQDGSREGQASMTGHRIFRTSFASVYPHYVEGGEEGAQQGVDQVIRWLTGYSDAGLTAVLKQGTDFAAFFAEAPAMNPARASITGTVCGVRVEAVEDPLMREIRYLDKLVDELAKGKAMEKVLRGAA